MSYASTGASSVFNLLKRGDMLFLAEGLDMFRVATPPPLAGRTLAESGFRQKTGCNVVAVVEGNDFDANPDPQRPLSAASELIVVGDTEAEARFFKTWGGK